MCANNAIFDHPSGQCVPNNGRGRCWARENGTEFRMVAGNFTQPPYEEDGLSDEQFAPFDHMLIDDNQEAHPVEMEK